MNGLQKYLLKNLHHGKNYAARRGGSFYHNGNSYSIVSVNGNNTVPGKYIYIGFRVVMYITPTLN